ncbi:uncharacterized protein LOC111629573 [Centruroides sculpturatus]|uniref:uncharacterized protein LOC111629573 n=1 Tax=Centruroides sculpturatus TaxID=218467 RepID=UPI000C6E7198|nr:uncharacterized protein LOC111629573 [Centruroides sculpturatus]
MQEMTAKKVLIALGIATICTIFILNNEINWKSVNNYSVVYSNYNIDEEEPFPDPKQSCKLPRIHPFDESILRYLQDSKPIYCKVRQDPLTYVNDSGFLVFNKSHVRGSSPPNCDFKYIIRKSDDVVIYTDSQSLPLEGVILQHDFVIVSCYNFAGISYYTNYHAHIHRIALKKVEDKRKRYNVMLLGIDSLSRLAFIRQLPKTYNYLTKVMGTHVLRGMTKIGDNTFPNLIALLTGKFPEELALPEDKTYDQWPCIWKDFSKEGYATMFVEDRPDISLFNYMRKGFHTQPTNHYFRPFMMSLEDSKVHRFSSHLCFGETPKHLLLLNYADKFIKNYNSYRPYFGFIFFVELSHDYVSQVSIADDDLTKWLRDKYENDYLNDTIFILFSDHGHRFDSIRTTLVGRIEERMPFFSIYVPPSLVRENPQIMQTLDTNTGRLTTPFDTYYTLMDVLRHNTGSKLGSTSSSRGTTLFGTISSDRTCPQAGISEHYCTCEVETTLSLSDPKCQTASTLVVDAINHLILDEFSNNSICIKLNFSKLHRCEESLPNNKVLTNSRVYFGNLISDEVAKEVTSKLRILVEVMPSGGLFEATVLYSNDHGTYNVINDISRVNKYGNQSSCIVDPVLRKYCYCNK